MSQPQTNAISRPNKYSTAGGIPAPGPRKANESEFARDLQDISDKYELQHQTENGKLAGQAWGRIATSEGAIRLAASGALGAVGAGTGSGAVSAGSVAGHIMLQQTLKSAAVATLKEGVVGFIGGPVGTGIVIGSAGFGFGAGVVCEIKNIKNTIKTCNEFNLHSSQASEFANEAQKRTLSHFDFMSLVSTMESKLPSPTIESPVYDAIRYVILNKTYDILVARIKALLKEQGKSPKATIFKEPTDNGLTTILPDQPKAEELRGTPEEKEKAQTKISTIRFDELETRCTKSPHDLDDMPLSCLWKAHRNQYFKDHIKRDEKEFDRIRFISRSKQEIQFMIDGIQIARQVVCRLADAI